jgi:hypothetical protein
METKLLSTCSSNEAFDASTNCLSVLAQQDFSADLNLTAISENIRGKSNILFDSIGIEKKSEFTAEISDLDNVFDDSLICFKKFVDANMSLTDVDKVEKANKIWTKIQAKNPYLYKLGYEEQMTQALSLFSDLDQEEYQDVMSGLFGVNESYAPLKAAHTNLQNMYRKGQEVKAIKETIIPSNVLRKEVVEVINTKLIPYLGILTDSQPEIYGETYTKISHYIELVNTKIRTRRSRAANEEEVVSEVE